MTELKPSAQPANHTHGNSIDAVGFSISFSKKFTEEDLEKLLGLESLLKESLPIFSRLQETQVEVQHEHVANRRVSLRGITLQRVARRMEKATGVYKSVKIQSL